MGAFKKLEVYWIDCYLDKLRKRGLIGPDKKLAGDMLQKSEGTIAKGRESSSGE